MSEIAHLLRDGLDRPPPPEPPTASPSPMGDTSGADTGWATEPVATSWTPVDLTAVLDGDLSRPKATILRRTDGAGLLYRDRVNLLYGRPESGKSWLAYLAVVEAIRDDHQAVIVDLESDPSEVLPRLLALGLSREAIAAQLVYIRPTDPLQAINPHAAVQADRDLTTAVERGPAVIVLDAIGELFALHALDPLSNRDAPAVTTWLRRLAETSGAAVIALDHVPHTQRDGGGSAPIGAQHKLAAATGASYEVKAHRNLAPGKTGEISLFIAKDRPGSVRAVCTGKTAAHITLDAETHAGQILATVQADKTLVGEPTAALRKRMEQVHAALEAAGDTGLSKNAVRREVTGKAAFTDDALDALIAAGEVLRRPGTGNALLHVLAPTEAAADVPL